MVNNVFHKKLLKYDFSKMFPEGFKSFAGKLGTFCLQIALRKGQSVKNHLVVKQVYNIKKSYQRYGGGMEIKLMKGFDIKLRSWKSLYLCSEVKESWFIIITPSEELLMKFAYEYQMEAFNMRLKYRTVFSKG